MIGSLIRIEFRSKSFLLNVPGLAALLITTAILIADALPPAVSVLLIIAGTILVATVYVLIAVAIDLLLALNVGQAEMVGPAMVSATGSTGVWRFPSAIAERRLIGVAAAALGSLAVFSLFAAGWAHRSSDFISATAFVFAVLLGGSSLVRLCPIQGFPGGNAGRRSLKILGGDEDASAVSGLIISYGSSTIFALTGFLILANPGPWGPWGLICLVIGLDCAFLTHWQSQRTKWVGIASERTLDMMRFSRLPTVSQSAPVSELFSIFAVEGNRATIVVTDERGQPCGLIQLRHLKNAARSGRSVRPNELMLTLSHVPRFSCDASVLDAAISLEQRGVPALVTQCGEGKLRVISLEELLRLGE